MYRQKITGRGDMCRKKGGGGMRQKKNQGGQLKKMFSLGSKGHILNGIAHLC